VTTQGVGWSSEEASDLVAPYDMDTRRLYRTYCRVYFAVPLSCVLSVAVGVTVCPRTLSSLSLCLSLLVALFCLNLCTFNVSCIAYTFRAVVMHVTPWPFVLFLIFPWSIHCFASCLFVASTCSLSSVCRTVFSHFPRPRFINSAYVAHCDPAYCRMYYSSPSCLLSVSFSPLFVCLTHRNLPASFVTFA
jgi:hypothetical protein